jgi:FKBP-type peptidyl-prolyl cis-trans isomerase FkpA
MHFLFIFTPGDYIKTTSMYKKITFLLFMSFITLFAAAQNTKAVAAPIGRPVYNFIKINSKLQYVFIEDKPGKVHPQEGDDVMMRMIAICNNRFMYSSAQVNKGKPGAFSISKAAFEGDIADALMLMTAGDSIICMVDAKSMFDYSKKKMPDYIKPGDKIQYNIRLVSIKPKAELQKEREAAMLKATQDQNIQQNTDDEALNSYFKAKNISPIKTTSGMYYSIQKEGSGSLAMPGDVVVMNYRGTLPDGTVFDSNLDSAFLHVQPLTFTLGTGRVIKGWDEGIGYLKAGSKASFYIPSSLAYGSQSRPATAANPKGIPANSVLIFDVELVSVNGMK